MLAGAPGGGCDIAAGERLFFNPTLALPARGRGVLGRAYFKCGQQALHEPCRAAVEARDRVLWRSASLGRA